MSGIEEQLAGILADPLGAAPEGGALGYVGLDIPPDLLLAASGFARHLPWDSRAPATRAAAWLEGSFPPWACAILEDWASGRFDRLEHVVFSRGEDACHRLYYYVCELQRLGRIAGPQPLIFDVARIPRESSRRHTVRSLSELSERLGLDGRALRRGIERANALRSAFARLRAQPDARGSLIERIVRASLFADVRELVAQWAPQPQEPRRRVALIGSAPPDDRIHRLIEHHGGCVVEDLHDRNLSRLGPAVDEGAGDPLAAIAHGWLEQRFWVRDFADPVARVLEAIDASRVDVAILWLIREDEGLAWHVPLLQEALRQARVPTLALTARAWQFNDGADAQIEEFLAMQAPAGGAR